MKKVEKVLWAVLLFAVPWGAEGQSYAKRDPIRPTYCDIELVSYDKSTGELILELRINFAHYDARFTTCDAVTVRVSGVDGLEYSGPEGWEVQSDTLAPDFLTRLEVTAPPNDTSGLIVTMGCGEHQSNYPTYFITTADTLRAVGSNPREWPRMPTEEESRLARLKDYERAKREWEAQQESLKQLYPPEGKMITGKKTRSEAMHYKIRMLEMHPLTDKDREEVWVGDTIYVRERGETKFRVIPPMTEEEITQFLRRRQDSVTANPPDSAYDVILDLRDSANYSFAKSLLEKLIPTDSAGFFRGVMNRPTLMKLTERGIKFWPSRCWPEPCKPQRRNKGESSNPPDKTDTLGSSQKKPSEELFYEDFEYSDWIDYWDVYDGNPNSGNDYWWRVNDGTFVFSGWYSAWCAGSNGSIVTTYDDDMQAIMEMTFAVDVSQHDNVEVSYWVYYDTETGYDYLDVFTSFDGYTWQHQREYTGSSLVWEQDFIPVPNSDYLYVRFQFYSDWIYSDWAGALVDEISISGDPTAKPNLTWYWPGGWDWPIVASPITGTHTVDNLYEGEPTYIDWAIWNDGWAPCGTFYTGLYIDDNIVAAWGNTGLDVFDTAVVIDYEKTFGYGIHTLRIKADYTNLVDEEDETDNEYEKTFWWDEPEITYTGYVKYWDMNPIATPDSAAQGVLVQMMDVDGMNFQVLASDWTNDWGYFQLGPVTNNNDTQDKDPGIQQDLFFRILADNGACYVQWPGLVTYQHSTATFYNHRSGVFDTLIQIPQDSSGPFFIADVVQESKTKWLQFRLEDPGKLRVILGDLGTWYGGGTNTMYIDNSNDSSHGYPDTFDRDVILHEYGHRIADTFSFFVDTVGGSHSWVDILPLEKAASEGWADFWSSVVRNDVYQLDYWNYFTEYDWVNLENGEYGYFVSTYGSANAMGKYNEGATAGIFRDIYDENDDDYSDVNDWGTLNLGPHPDGIGDTLSNGIDTILITLLDSAALGHRPDNIDEFWYTWRYPSSLGHIKAMMDIWYEHGEGCCIGIRGNVDYDLLDQVNVADLTYLVDFLFRYGPPPPCREEGNVDGDAGEQINVADQTYLIDHLFRGGPPPPPCP